MIAPFTRRRSSGVWLAASLALHAVWFVLMFPHRPVPVPDEPLFTLPDTVEFGIAEAPGEPGAAPAPPAAAAAPEPPKPAPPKLRARKAPVAAEGIAVVQDAGPPAEREPAIDASPGAEPPAAVSGSGTFGEGLFGEGEGGEGEGSGGVRGATIALNVDLERVRSSALLLETRALLDIIPEWQALLAGSGLDPVRDFRRVFVAAPSLDRSALIVSAQHALSRAKITAAVNALAAERGTPAPFRDQAGLTVAPWRNRGPTERIVAITRPDQLLITRPSELPRVLQVSHSLGELRKRQGFAAGEVDARGGLLAMHGDEAVALWVEGVARYVRGAEKGVPMSLRLSIFRFDQFHTELVATGQYRSDAQAADALGVLDGLRRELIDHPRVTFLGLSSALAAANIEQRGSALRLDVRLTLHQTRYLLAYVTRALRPKPSR